MCSARALCVLLAWLLPAGLADSTASCGLTAIGLRCGGATVRRASAAARVADLTRQYRLQVVMHSQPSGGWQSAAHCVLYVRVKLTDAATVPLWCCLQAA